MNLNELNMKSIVTSLFLLLVFTLPGFSQLRPIQDNKGRWGYADANGSLVIKCKFNSATEFNNGKAKVGLNDNYGIMDEQGNFILPIKYRSITDWMGKCYQVAFGGKVEDGVLFDEKYGFVSYEGKVILEPVYSDIGSFVNGVAYVKSNDLYGFITEDLRLLIPCQYKAVGLFNEQGLVWVNKGGKFDKENSSKIVGGKFGVYNRNGELVVPVSYSSLGCFKRMKTEFSEEALNKMDYWAKQYATLSAAHRLLIAHKLELLFEKLDFDDCRQIYVSNKKDGSKNGILDINGNVIVPVGQYDFVYGEEEGFSVVYHKKKGYNYLNVSSGELLQQYWRTNSYAFYNGVAIQSNGENNMFLIDQKGETVSLQYNTILPIKDDVYIVANSNGVGLLNKFGKEIITPSYDVILPSTDGLMLARKTVGEMFGFMNNSGTYVIEPKYEVATAFENGLSCVKFDSKWGIINTEGVDIVPCKWDDILKPGDVSINRVWVKNNNLWYCVDSSTGNLAFDKGYDGMSNYSQFIEDVAIVIDNGKTGIIDKDGAVIIPCVLEDHVGKLRYAYDMLRKTNRDQWREVDTYRVNIRFDKNLHKSKLTDRVSKTMWDY